MTTRRIGNDTWLMPSQSAESDNHTHVPTETSGLGNDTLSVVLGHTVLANCGDYITDIYLALTNVII